MLRPALEEGASQSQIARTHQLSKSAVQPRSRFTPVPVALRSALPLALWSFHLENCDSHGLYKQTLPPLPLGPYPLFFSLRLSHKLISYCYHEVILLGPMRFCFKNIKQLCKKFVLFHLLINLELSVHQVTGNIIAAPSFEIVKRKMHFRKTLSSIAWTTLITFRSTRHACETRGRKHFTLTNKLAFFPKILNSVTQSKERGYFTPLIHGPRDNNSPSQHGILKDL